MSNTNNLVKGSTISNVDGFVLYTVTSVDEHNNEILITARDASGHEVANRVTWFNAVILMDNNVVTHPKG